MIPPRRHVGQEPSLVVDAEQRVEGSLRERRLVAQLEKRDKLWLHLESQPEDERAIASLAKLQAELGEAGDFVALARQLCRREPRAWRGACRALRGRLGLEREAVELLLEVHQADPGNAEVCCQLARLQPGQAARWHEQALRGDPGCAPALVASADAARRAERFDEAARLYKMAHSRIRLGARSLYRLGEALVRDGHRSEGREYLLQVLQESDTACHVHASVTLALAHVLDQEYEQALEHCRRAEDLQARHGQGGSQELKLARTLKGLSQLSLGLLDQAVEALRCASLQDSDEAGASRWCWDEAIQSALGFAETLRGDFAAADRHLDLARRLAGPSPSADVLVSSAYLRRAQGDVDSAQSFLQRALAADKNSPVALLHMGYLLLCQEQQLEVAIQFLQKCLQQPIGTLAYGAAQRGMAHLYLCVAHHLRGVAEGRLGEHVASDLVAQEHFLTAHSLQPCLRRALASLGAAAHNAGAATLSRSGASSSSTSEAVARLVTGEPPRMGLVDLTPKQASVALLYAEVCSLLPAGPPKAVTPRARADVDDTLSKKAALSASPTGPTLVGTSSTAAPSSPGPSRDASDHSLLNSGLGQSAPAPPRLSEAATALALGRRLLADQVLRLSDIELGECVSRGEFAVVHRGSLRGREVVVKALQPGACGGGRDGSGSAATELLAEICVVAELNHPRIVTFVGACLEPKRIALVTELAHGGNLHQALHVRHRRFSRAECFQLSTELLEGVLYLHMQQPTIAHLDIKSMNLVLDAEGQHLQICDFGLARALCGSGDGVSSPDPRERPPSRAGSPRYMAPECYDSNLGSITEKADVWSSGCVLIEIFGARLPYAECGNVQQILKAMLVHHTGPCIPSSIEAPVRSIATSMLAFEAQQRPSIAQVLPQLQAAAGPPGVGETSRFFWVSP